MVAVVSVHPLKVDVDVRLVDNVPFCSAASGKTHHAAHNWHFAVKGEGDYITISAIFPVCHVRLKSEGGWNSAQLQNAHRCRKLPATWRR